jgi:hypothetical protein
MLVFDRVANARLAAARRNRVKKAEKEPLDIPEIVNNAIDAIGKRLTDLGAKGTIGDLIRLLQLRDEVTVQPQGLITAGWVSECRKNLNDR